ncbi:hypothetical protein [Parasphingorhabdus sp.]|jgi:hypothetical protein|uniref:hypothetical protein n=1 Tax=Parasphingorhabdus sp. TaxID=2709688 RepID=UPI003001A61A
MRKLEVDHVIILAGIFIMLTVLTGLFMLTSIAIAVSDCGTTETSISGDSAPPQNQSLTAGRPQNLNRDI